MSILPPVPLLRRAPLAAPVVFAVALAVSACAPAELRDDLPGRAQGLPPLYAQTSSADLDPLPPSVPARRTWSQIQATQAQKAPAPSHPSQTAPQADRMRASEPDTAQPPPAQPPPKRRRGSSSPPPDPAVLPQPPRPVPLPPVSSTQSATDAFKRDLIRPEVDRMRTDDAMGRLDPLGQRDLMRRENDLRQWGDPLAR